MYFCHPKRQSENLTRAALPRPAHRPNKNKVLIHVMLEEEKGRVLEFLGVSDGLVNPRNGEIRVGERGPQKHSRASRLYC